MWTRKSDPERWKDGRINQLKSRLRTLTGDYAPFFAGFSLSGSKRQRLQTVGMLTDLQHLRRVQLALMLAQPQAPNAMEPSSTGAASL